MELLLGLSIEESSIPLAASTRPIMNNAGVSQSRAEATSAMSRLSLTACLRCREQKLRCGRERPRCTRCSRIDAICQYPSPPDRRGPRGQRSGSRLSQRAAGRERGHAQSQRVVLEQPYNRPEPQQTSTRGLNLNSAHQIASRGHDSPLEGDVFPSNEDESGGTSVPSVTGSHVLSDSYSTQLRLGSLSTLELGRVSDQPSLPPTALGLSLLEIYFSRVYNASLLFHKPVIFQQYLTGELHETLLKALLALATLFLRPTNNDDDGSKGGVEHMELKLLRAYYPCGLSWAKAAEREAFMLAVDSPCLMITQALECLQLYWFGIGQPHSANLCLALAYRSCHLLGYSKKVISGSDDSAWSLDSELSRRCFWACWTSTCIVMEPEPYITSCWQEAAELPLPGLISNTISGPSITLNEKMDGSWHSRAVDLGNKPDTHPGAAACLIKMVGLWAKIQLSCNYRANQTAQNLELMQQLSSVAKSLFDNAITVRESGLSNSSSEDQVLILVHDAIYHQCQMTLHSMNVPLFSGVPADPKVDLDTQKQSAKTVVKHAELFYSLLESFFSGKYHVSRIPPLVGYGAFVAGLVLLIAELSCQGNDPSTPSVQGASSNYRFDAARSILHLLDDLRIYWPSLQHSWEKLHAALDMGSSKQKCPHRPVKSQNGPDQLPVQANAFGPSETSARNNNSRNASQGQLQVPTTDSNAMGRIETQDRSHSTLAMDSQVEAPDELGQSGSLSNQVILPEHHDWYNPGFTGAEAEQFVGIDPSTIFQQGWGTFG